MKDISTTNMKLVWILVIFGLTSTKSSQQADFLGPSDNENVGSVEENLNALLERFPIEQGDDNGNTTDVASTYITKSSGDLEQFILHSEELLQQEHVKLETLTVRSSSLEEEVDFLKSTINHLEDKLSLVVNVLKKQIGVKTQQQEAVGVDSLAASDYGGVTYIRWGRTECPYNAEAVYEGSVATSHFTNTGGGSDYLCVPEKPEWGTILTGRQSWRSYLCGVEYAVDSPGYPFSATNNNGQNLNNNDATCVVCHVPTRSNQLMIPAKLNCPVGWVKEYNGYLATSHYKQYRNSYVCVDGAPEVMNGGEASKNGSPWYPVESACDTALPCPKYVDGWEVSCVVCTK